MKKGICTVLLFAFGLMSMSFFVKTDRLVSAKRENVDYKMYYDLDKDRMPFVNMYPNYAVLPTSAELMRII